MTKESAVAFDVWKSSHKYDRRFEPIHAEFIGQDPIVLFFAAEDDFKWSVQYRGDGHYFESLPQAFQFIQSKKKDTVQNVIDAIWELECYLGYLSGGGSKSKKDLAWHILVARQARLALINDRERGAKKP
jgi:hypothetical protein